MSQTCRSSSFKMEADHLQSEESDEKRELGAMHEPRSMDSLEHIERQHILRVLERTGWLISGPNGAGAILNVHPNTLRSLMERLGIRRATHDFATAAQSVCRPGNGDLPAAGGQSDPHAEPS